jgi:DNA-binding response OmpR family regulator
MKTLLLADDSVTIQRVMELTFADEDIRVVSVGDGRRALQWMESERPDIVLVDVGAPEVNGYDVAAHVRRSPAIADVPVLLLAGAFEPVDEERAREVGCSGVLVKPFEPQDVVRRVNGLLQRRTGGDDAAHGRADRTRRSVEPESMAVVTPFPGAVRLAMAHAAPDAAQVERREGVAAPATRVSLANAFSALLAAEQSTQPAIAAQPGLSDVAVEEAVRRVLARMTDEAVREIVVETAERLIRAEIEKIKANPE